MRSLSTIAVSLLATFGLACVALADAGTVPVGGDRLDTGHLGDVHLAPPVTGQLRRVVVLFSDRGGWNEAAAAASSALAAEGAYVVGVDLPAYEARIDAGTGGGCHDLVADIESVSRQLQRESSESTYRSPIVAGLGEGGALAYPMLAQAPAATLAGAVALDPTAAVHTRIPLCPGAPSAVAAPVGFSYGPVAALPGFLSVGLSPTASPDGARHVHELEAASTPMTVAAIDQGTPAAEALAALVRPHLDSPRLVGTPDRPALPLVELPAASPSPYLAIVLSGDGGWRDLDKSIAEYLQGQGVSVVGWDSLRYFWSLKTPDETARDLATVVDTYSERWRASKVALIGYSFGAGVLPFAYNRLPADLKRRVVQISLLGFADAADFEISVAGWLGAAPSKDAKPTLPEMARIDPALVQCFYGEEEDDSACPTFAANGAVQIIRTKGGHHFDEDYDALARRILEGLRRRSAG